MRIHLFCFFGTSLESNLATNLFVSDVELGDNISNMQQCFLLSYLPQTPPKTLKFVTSNFQSSITFKDFVLFTRYPQILHYPQWRSLMSWQPVL